MKDLNGAELKQFRVNAPAETQVGLNMVFGKTQVSSFEFPTEDSKILKIIVSFLNRMEETTVRISSSVYNKEALTENVIDGMRKINMKDIALFKKHIQNEDETLVWQFIPQAEYLRGQGFRFFKGTDFDMTSFVIHFNEYTNELPDFEVAFDKKVQKNKGYMYSRGSVGEWKFVHALIEDEAPWEKLKAISKREFGDNMTQVFFNNKTMGRPNEYVIWYKPGEKYLI